MELSKFHRIPWNFPFDLEKFHGIPWNFWRVPWNSMELWNIDVYKFHNWGSVFHCLLHDLMLLYIRLSTSSWNIDIFFLQSNFLVPLILLKWRYSILNGGLLYIYIYALLYEFYWCPTIPHIPGCFCPWTFFQNIGFNMVPSDPFMSHLATQLEYSAGEFQALQLIVLATFGIVD